MHTLESLLSDAGLTLLERDIGSGGSATVHKCQVSVSSARLPVDGVLIAAKEYRPEILRDPNQIQRIRQEAEIGGRLQHANVIRTFGLLGDRESNPAVGGPLVLLLEWIDGLTLDSWYASPTKPVSWEAIRSVARDLTSAVGELHRSNVFHRDIKPENAMVRAEDASTVLMDIGVAELASGDETTLHTSVKDFVGSARYASPQFILGNAPFAASDDVYSLGATLFLLMTGSTIYSEVERKSVLPIVVVNNRPELRGLADEIPASMRVLLQGMLHSDPKRRPTLDEVRESLENPDAASYLTKELSRQTNDIRSYVVLEVDRWSCFADLQGDDPKLDETYTIVRPLRRQISVPSYKRELTPEVWVADATLKHVHQNVGHFAIHRQRWQEGRSALSFGLPTGQWVHEEGNELTVTAGDLVLRKIER
jgi:serine/threonine protein kinase